MQEFGGLWLQLHVGERDNFWRPDDIAIWRAEAERAGIAAEVFVYPDAGHFFTDPSFLDYQDSAAHRIRERVLQFLHKV